MPKVVTAKAICELLVLVPGWRSAAKFVTINAHNPTVIFGIELPCCSRSGLLVKQSVRSFMHFGMGSTPTWGPRGTNLQIEYDLDVLIEDRLTKSEYLTLESSSIKFSFRRSCDQCVPPSSCLRLFHTMFEIFCVASLYVTMARKLRSRYLRG